MQNYGFHQYQNTEVTTVDGGKLVVLLYEGAIKFLARALQSVNNNDIEGKCNNINRAQDIINELNNSLKIDIGGETAHNLRSLYIFMNKHLLQAKISKNGCQKINEVADLLKILNEGWREVASRPEVKDVLRNYERKERGIDV